MENFNKSHVVNALITLAIMMRMMAKPAKLAMKLALFVKDRFMYIKFNTSFDWIMSGFESSAIKGARLAIPRTCNAPEKKKNSWSKK